MANRSVLQWDKDDCAAMGLVKFDLLGLGMLSALHYAVDLVREHEGVEVDFAQLDLEEPAVYEMLQRADSVGVFQVESRAQMATLPRLKPRTFYDLVVEVALIRPGPIQGGSVHPYIRRRNGLEPVTYDHPVMERSLAKTLGIPLFQEQLMQLAVDVAGFDAGEADQLRRAMGAKRSSAEDGEAARAAVRRDAQHLHGITGEVADRHLRAAAGVRQLRVRRVARAVLRRAGLLLVLAEAAPPGGVLRGAAQRPADGLLLAAVAGRRRPPARGDGAPAGHQYLQARRRISNRGRTADRRSGWGWPGSAPSAPSSPRRSSPSRPAGGYRDAGRAHQGGHPDHRAGRGAGHRRCARRADRDGATAGTDRRSALWAAGAAAGPRAGTLAGTHRRPGGAAAAGDERHRADRRRHLGHRDLPGVAIRPSSPGEQLAELGGADRDRTCSRSSTAPGCWSPGWSPTGSARPPRPGSSSSTSRTRPACSTSSARSGCGPGTAGSPGGPPSLLIRGVVERDGGAISIVADRIAAVQSGRRHAVAGFPMTPLWHDRCHERGVRTGVGVADPGRLRGGRSARQAADGRRRTAADRPGPRRPASPRRSRWWSA